jgi:hypothetical protein
MMKMLFVYNGDPERIPTIGTQLPTPKAHVLFKVEAYGATVDVPAEQAAMYDNPNEVVGLELEGCLVVPKGSPIEVLEDLLGGKL